MWTRVAAVVVFSAFSLGCGAAEPGGESVGTVQEAVSAPLAGAYCTAQVIGKGAKSTEDDYLPHVITCENGGANLEALKAQAIAARSVLYYNMATSGSICDSQGCQVYSCGAAPQAKHYQAVKETAGMYLSYAGTLTYGFYVAGDSGAKAPSCKDYGGSTTKYITYNQGKTGTAVKQTSLGWIGPAGNGQNRGCMGQWGARCLENHKGYDYKQILRFYYGADVQILKATGPCTQGCEPTHCEGSKIVSSCGKGDCAAFGADCVKDSLGVRCVNVFCPAKGKTKACVDDSLIIDCNDGAPSEPGDCSAYAAYCTTAGVSSARCVSAFCVAGPHEVPKAHDVCMPDGTLAHCTKAGLPEGAKACPSGTKCVAKNGGAACESGSSGPGGAGGAGGSAGLAGAPWEDPDPSGGAASASHRTRIESGDDGGCRVAAPRGQGRNSPWLFVLGAVGLFALRRRRAMAALLRPRLPHRQRALALAALLGSLGCSVNVAEEEGEYESPPASTVAEELSSISCSEKKDTGYTKGKSFPITVVTVDGKPVEKDTANAYYVMAQAAAKAGVTLKIVSGFRTMAQQQYLYGCYVNCNCNNCNLAAKPGYSNHQSGHALDLNTSSSGVLNWLNANGAKYGFTRTVPGEPWHWEWWGGGPGGGPCSCKPTHCEGSKIVSSCGKGDCAAYGANCVNDAKGVRCVNVFCPANGKTKVCVDDSTIMECNDGAPSAPGECSTFGAYCSEAGTESARCVSVFCVAGPKEVPKAHDVCLPDGTIAHCTKAGAITDAKKCAGGKTCVDTANGAECPGGASPGSGGAGNAGAAGSAGGAGMPWGDPTGDPIGVAGQGANPARPVASADQESGCSLSPRRGSPHQAAWVLALAIALVVRRRRHMSFRPWRGRSSAAD